MEPERRLKGRNGWGRLQAALKSDPPVHNLLRAKNGLDNRDHFRDLEQGTHSADYRLTQFNGSFTREWSVPVLRTDATGEEFDLVQLKDGYLAQIGNLLVEYDWSGTELWRSTESEGKVHTIAVPTADGFLVVAVDLNIHHCFHVKRFRNASE